MSSSSDSLDCSWWRLVWCHADQVRGWHYNCSVLSLKQRTHAMAVDQRTEFQRYRRLRRCDQFLATMGRVVSCDELSAVIWP